MSSCRPRFLGFVFLAALQFIFLERSSASAEARPNIILIVADDLGCTDLQCYGSKFHHTPQLDKLAGSGKRFTEAYAACHVCSPTRAALLTGLHPARLHITDWLPGRQVNSLERMRKPMIKQQLPLEEVTLAERLKAAGYATAHIGKWHLGGEGFEPTRQGFDINIAGDHTGTPLSYVAPFAKNGRSMPGLENAPEGEYLTDRLTLEAEKFIETNRHQPFFLYLPFYAVHTPMTAKPDLIARYPLWDGIPHGRQENPIYAAMLESVDDGVGRIVTKLEQLKLTNQTVVVFTSDNGGLATKEGPNTPATNNAPFREGKGWLYEGGLRVPLLISWPGQIPAGIEATPVWSGDITPTVLGLAEIATDDPMDGVRLDELVTKNKPVEQRSLFWHYPHYSNQGGRPGAAIREGDWKLVEFYESDRHELFDIVHDARESKNLAEEHPQRVSQMAARLDAWRKSLNVQMAEANPDYIPNPQAGDGTVTIPASSAMVHGVMLRYEPLPHKNTLGYWVRQEDWAEFDLTIKQPGVFEVVGLIGCGNSSGNSRVEVRVNQQKLEFTVRETGGFQMFEPQEIGRLDLPAAGRYRIEVRPLSKPGPAVMDLREIRLKPIAQKN